MQSQTQQIKPRVNKALFYATNDCNKFVSVVWDLLIKDYGCKDGDLIFEFPSVFDDGLPSIIKTLKVFPDIHYMITGSGAGIAYDYSTIPWKILPSVEGLFDIGEYDMAQVLLYSYAQYYCLGRNSEEEFQRLKSLNAQDRFDELTDYLANNIAQFNAMSNKFRLTRNNFYKLEKDIKKNSYQVMQNIIEHIRSSPNAYVVDEDGKPFDLSFTGIETNPNGIVDYKLPMVNGKPHGAFSIADHNDLYDITGEFEYGFLKTYSYIEKSSLYKDLEKKFIYEYEKSDNTIITTEVEFFNNSNQPEQSSQYYECDTSKNGTQKKWFENGQLCENKYCIDNEPLHWQSFFEDGSIKSKGKKDTNGQETSIRYFDNRQKYTEKFVDKNGLQYEFVWFHDGVLKSEIKYDYKGNYIGHYEYYSTGNKKSILIKQKSKIIDYIDSYWDEEGNQTISNGSGYIKTTKFDCIETKEYQNGRENGFRRGVREDGTLLYEHRYKDGYQQVVTS